MSFLFSSKLRWDYDDFTCLFGFRVVIIDLLMSFFDSLWHLFEHYHFLYYLVKDEKLVQSDNQSLNTVTRYNGFNMTRIKCITFWTCHNLIGRRIDHTANIYHIMNIVVRSVGINEYTKARYINDPEKFWNTLKNATDLNRILKNDVQKDLPVYNKTWSLLYFTRKNNLLVEFM